MVESIKNKILWFDCETTGFSPVKNDIVEIAGIIEINGTEVETFDLKCRPLNLKNIHPGALEIIGGPMGKNIEETRIEILSWPDPRDVFIELIRIFSKYINKVDPKNRFTPAGQNIGFDIAFLSAFFEKMGNKYFESWLKLQVLDTLSLIKRCVRKRKMLPLENNKLGTICKHFKVPLEAHNALSDIKATKAIAEILLKMLG